MTLTLPTPDAGDTARQRFALELLLQQPVPGLEQLLASRNLLNNALPDVSPNQWRTLQAMPIAIGARARDDCGGGRNRGIHPAGDVPADVHRV